MGGKSCEEPVQERRKQRASTRNGQMDVYHVQADAPMSTVSGIWSSWRLTAGFRNVRVVRAEQLENDCVVLRSCSWAGQGKRAEFVLPVYRWRLRVRSV